MGCAAGARAESSAVDAGATGEMMMEPEAAMAAPVEMPAQDMDYRAGTDFAEEAMPSAKKAKRIPDEAVEASDGEQTVGAGSPSEAAAPFDEGTPSRARRPLLIYQAELGLGVFRVQENLDKIEKLALDAGGYLVARGENRITVRVPAQDFEPTVDVVLKLGDVHRREIVAQDVTAEFLDIQIRLKNALAVRERLQELLQRAQDVKEALKVEEELGRIAEQIEVMKGRLKYLREVTSFSTISVEFSERSAPIDARVELPFGWLHELGLNTLLSL